MTTKAEWLGRAMSAGVVLYLAVDAAIGAFKPEMLEADMIATGFPFELGSIIGGIIVACAVLYAVPQTAVPGAILITGFLGGAICTDFRIGEIGSPPQLICLALGIATWGDLWFRDARVRALLPLRKAGG